ncbi:MAG: hydroxymethylbilane synthase [Proteobacteria bacterium]|nr:hydroxymethylbilane synthase [Pseudomonadota bacterium]
MKTRWIVGTRGSRLALKQTELTIETLKKIYPDFDFPVKIIKTTGDTVWDTPLNLIGGKGLFVKEIEEALLREEIDIAIHSMKDLPTELGKALTVGAILKREDPRDVFISLIYENINNVEKKAKIGTSSIRRKSQILYFNRNIEVVNLRGNVDTRIRKLTEQGLDGIILAYAGVKRMGFDEYIKEVLPFEIMVPPAGQGAIGVEIRDESEALHMLKPINHENSFLEVSIERKLQAAIRGGCNTPLGINAKVMDKNIDLHVVLFKDNGDLSVKEKFEGSISYPDDLVAKALKIMPKT